SLIAARKGVSVSALDFSTNMLRHLESRITADGLNTISTHKGDGQDLPFDDATFDAAFSMFGLMFFPDRETGYKEMRRTVKPGGYACVSSWAPMSQSSLIFNLWQALLEIAPDLPDAMGAIPSLSDPEILEAEMVEAGFHEVEIRAVEHGATFPTAREFWAAMERGSEPIAVLKSKTTAEAWREKSRRAVRHLEENAGPFPRHLSAKAWIGIGRK
ncbi:MAG: methyltransferase domain-containing protein, partial [Pseudomonadota bacterium]